MKANFDVVDEVFIDAVVDNAEIKDVSPLDISLILFPSSTNHHIHRDTNDDRENYDEYGEL